MHYLTTPFTLNFGPNTRPSYRSQVNGMSTKTNAVTHALNCDAISEVDPESREDLLIEPLWFKPHGGDDNAPFEDRLNALRAHEGKKYLLCSEFTPLRWFGKHASEIVGLMDGVFASCEYQQHLLETISIDVQDVVYEPVNEHLFFPAATKSEMVVAIGSPTLVKNIDAIIEIFTELGDNITTVFIGSPIVWGKLDGMKNEGSFKHTMDSHARLKAVSTQHYRALPQTQVAYLLSQAKYCLNFAYHETCCRTAMEAMLSGCGLMTGKHPLWDEYPVLKKGIEPMEVADILKSAPPVDIGKTRDWALSNVSYKAFSEKIRELLQ